MSGAARRTILRSTQLRSLPPTSTLPALALTRSYASPSAPNPPPPSSQPIDSPPSKPKSKLPSKPYTITQPPQFPPPNDPFLEKHNGPAGVIKSAAVPETGASVVGEAAPAATTTATGAAAQEYSDTTKAVVRGVARLMGYNSKASTAIRETQRMMGGIVEAAERDRVYWYDECELPPTYQSFFQLHLLYVLILLPRLRALPASSPSTSHPIPEPLEPSEPHSASSAPSPSSPATSAASPPPSTGTSTSTSGAPILGKPDYESYPTELLTHFFELAESEMRKVLGRGEKERVVRKYMDEMGTQWKGAGVGLDYVLGLTLSDLPEERAKADAELVSWVWRNLFASRGLTPTPANADGSGLGSEGEVDAKMLEQLEQVARFVRREMQRLDRVEDGDVLSGSIGHWGSVRE